MLVDALAEKMDVEICDKEELKELEEDIKPDAVLNKLEKNIHANEKRKSAKYPRATASSVKNGHRRNAV